MADLAMNPVESTAACRMPPSPPSMPATFFQFEPLVEHRLQPLEVLQPRLLRRRQVQVDFHRKMRRQLATVVLPHSVQLLPVGGSAKSAISIHSSLTLHFHLRRTLGRGRNCLQRFSARCNGCMRWHLFSPPQPFVRETRCRYDCRRG